MQESKKDKRPKKGLNERLKHLAWAAMIALVLQVFTLLKPVDHVFWVVQYTWASFETSGDIAFVGAEENLTDPEFPNRRVKLADLVDRIDRAGAKSIYVDLSFDSPTDAASDEKLRQTLSNTQSQTVLVENIKTGLNGSDSFQKPAPEIGEGVEKVGAHIWTDALGYAWRMPYNVTSEDEQLPNMAAHMAGVENASTDLFPVSYYFDLATIPTYTFSQLSRADNIPAELAGKTIVIGAIDPPLATKPNIPGLPNVSPSIVNIYAAETLMAGHINSFDGLAVLLCLAALLLAIGYLGANRWRYGAYGLAIASLPLALFITAQFALRMDVAGALVLLLIYGGCRARAVWRRSFRMVDADTNLPTFAALEADKTVSKYSPTIIIAKVHRFEEIRRTLPVELHTEYLLRIISRLEAATQEANIYVGQGHLIGWTMDEKEPALLKEHLEGLRALFSSPLRVGNNQVDVGITFGVDISPNPSVTRRVAAAVSALDNTNETFEPIAIADTASDEDLIWNISIQARIDAALENGEIFLVYQPKASVQTGELLGAEALVRWKDPIKGFIPTDQFIIQCENAGRMNHLTRHVMFQACLVALAFEREGQPIPISVNISATLLHERSIISMVRDVLEETGLDPKYLILEVTETYRISNLDTAAQILTELHELGLKISMDDFGVGAASLEALQQLPFSELKIDRLFISQMTSSKKSLGIVSNILNMGKDLGITVVAEGIEDDATLGLLRDSGCLVAQGYGIARPTTYEEVLDYQRKNAKHLIRKAV